MAGWTKFAASSAAVVDLLHRPGNVESESPGQTFTPDIARYKVSAKIIVVKQTHQ